MGRKEPISDVMSSSIERACPVGIVTSIDLLAYLMA
jgi:hypothetical protein